MKRALVPFFSAFLMLVAIRAQAALIGPNSLVGSWQIGAYSNDQTGQFSHCAMSASYKSGILMVFSIDREFKWRMGFANTAWNLQPGQNYPITYWIDGGTPLTGQARAISQTLVSVELAPSRALFERFRRGYELTVSGANQIFRFNLTTTARALNAVFSCTQRHVLEANNAIPSTNPFAAAPAGPTGRQNFKAEAATLTANLLSSSGIQGYYIVPPNDVPKLFASYDAVWVAPNVIGTVQVVLPQYARSTQDVSSALIASDAKSCTGSFVSGTIPERNSAAMTAFTGCQGQQTWTIYYTVLPRKTGGFYVLGAVTTAANGQSAKTASESIRTAAATVVH